MNKELIEKYSVIIAEFMGDFDKCPTITYKDETKVIKNKLLNENFDFSTLNYHTDWNEIHKVYWKLREILLKDNNLIYYNLIKTVMVSLEEPYQAFLTIGETIEYLNTIKK